MRDALKKQAIKLDLLDRMIFVGQLDSDGVRKELTKADIFINPSFTEGLPTVVLEALSMGVPTVATDVGGTKDIVGLVDQATLVPAP